MHSTACLPLCLDVVIGSTDEGSRGFAQMHRADSRLPSLQMTDRGTTRCRKKIKGNNAFIHLCPSRGAELDLPQALPDLTYNIACSVCEACMGAPRPVKPGFVQEFTFQLTFWRLQSGKIGTILDVGNHTYSC